MYISERSSWRQTFSEMDLISQTFLEMDFLGDGSV